MTLLLRTLIREIPKLVGLQLQQSLTQRHNSCYHRILNSPAETTSHDHAPISIFTNKIESSTHFRIGCHLEDPINIWTYFSTVEDFLYSELLATLHIEIKLLLYMTTSGSVRVSLHHCHVSISPNGP